MTSLFRHHDLDSFNLCMKSYNISIIQYMFKFMTCNLEYQNLLRANTSLVQSVSWRLILKTEQLVNKTRKIASNWHFELSVLENTIHWESQVWLTGTLNPSRSLQQFSSTSLQDRKEFLTTLEGKRWVESELFDQSWKIHSFRSTKIKSASLHNLLTTVRVCVKLDLNCRKSRSRYIHMR